ncbi:hypothetical protein [Kitasatospora sp. NPDC058478]|uniref:hypothetical protein n=1 Tax=unclassified Kitasatospora TaxID=2633591 RepID=UPI00364AF5F8
MVGTSPEAVVRDHEAKLTLPQMAPVIWGSTPSTLTGLLGQVQPEIDRQPLRGVQVIRRCIPTQGKGDRHIRLVQRRDHHTDADEGGGVRKQIGQTTRSGPR